MSLNTTVEHSIFRDAILASTSRSPLYALYGETVAGVTIIRAFGASSKFLSDMIRHIDTVCLFLDPSISHTQLLLGRIPTLSTGCGEV